MLFRPSYGVLVAVILSLFTAFLLRSSFIYHSHHCPAYIPTLCTKLCTESSAYRPIERDGSVREQEADSSIPSVLVETVQDIVLSSCQCSVHVQSTYRWIDTLQSSKSATTLVLQDRFTGRKLALKVYSKRNENLNDSWISEDFLCVDDLALNPLESTSGLKIERRRNSVLIEYMRETSAFQILSSYGETVHWPSHVGAICKTGIHGAHLREFLDEGLPASEVDNTQWIKALPGTLVHLFEVGNAFPSLQRYKKCTDYGRILYSAENNFTQLLSEKWKQYSEYLLSFIQQKGSAIGLFSTMQEKMNYLSSLSAELDKVSVTLTNQDSIFFSLVHGDVCPDNLLINGKNAEELLHYSHLSLVDFSKAHYGHALYDVANVLLQFPLCWQEILMKEEDLTSFSDEILSSFFMLVNVQCTLHPNHALCDSNRTLEAFHRLFQHDLLQLSAFFLLQDFYGSSIPIDSQRRTRNESPPSVRFERTLRLFLAMAEQQGSSQGSPSSTMDHLISLFSSLQKEGESSDNRERERERVSYFIDSITLINIRS